MAKSKDDRTLLPSVLDRLIVEDPQNSRDPVKSHDQVLSEIRRSVCRDLEDLLNTRRRAEPLPEDFEELQVSLVNYGIPDYTGASMAGHDERADLKRLLERVISSYETRLQQVRVKMVEEKTEHDRRRLRFRIEGVLFAETVAEQVVFDSELEPSRSTISVSIR